MITGVHSTERIEESQMIGVSKGTVDSVGKFLQCCVVRYNIVNKIFMWFFQFLLRKFNSFGRSL